MPNSIELIEDFSELKQQLAKKTRKKQVQKKPPNLSAQPWEECENISSEDKSKLLTLQNLCILFHKYSEENPCSSPGARVVDRSVSVGSCFVIGIWNLGSERELIRLVNDDGAGKMIRDILGINSGFSRSLYNRDIKGYMISKKVVITRTVKGKKVKTEETVHIFSPFKLLSEEKRKKILSEINNGYKVIFVDQVIASTSRRATNSASLFNYKGFQRGLGVTAFATEDGRIPLMMAMGPANLNERIAAELMVPELSKLGFKGTIVGDGAYDNSSFFKLCKQYNFDLLAAYNKRRAKTPDSITCPFRRANYDRLQTEEGKALMKRRSTGEHLFTIFKQTMGFEKHKPTSYDQAFMLLIAYMTSICYDSVFQKDNNTNTRKSPGRRFYQKMA